MLMIRQVKHMVLGLVLAATLAGVACSTACVNHPPPSLNPQATAAWYGTRVIVDLDLLRDIAIAANAQTPPLVTTDTTRKVVLWHESAIKVVHTADDGWKVRVRVGLEELVKTIPAKESAIIAPYVQIINSLLREAV
jgi:hypothetical protein